MNNVGNGMLIAYIAIIILSYAISAYFILGGSTSKKGKKSVARMIVSILGAFFFDVCILLGVHFVFFHNVQIFDFLQKLRNQNLVSRDMRVLLFSTAALISGAMMSGLFWGKITDKKRIYGKKKEAIILFCISASLLIFMLVFGVEDFYRSNIVLNEVCSDNESYEIGERGITDYIEVYNNGPFPYHISGLFLSDDAYNLDKLSLEGKYIAAGETLVVPCVDEINSFPISNKGETIYLSDVNGAILETLDVDELDDDTAYVRINESRWEVGVCSPGLTNDALLTVNVDSPTLSHNSGFYDADFELELSASEDTVIYYTLDGSVPDTGSYVYEEPILVYDKTPEPNVWNAVQNIVREWKDYTPTEEVVDKAFVIRAMAVDGIGNKSDIVTATYFIGQDKYKEHDVISLVADPDDLFGDERGIYVTGKEYDEWYLNGKQGDQPKPNFRGKGQEWEREAVVEMFEKTESILQQNIGIRIQGSGRRENEDKRFSLYARKEYSDSDVFDIPFYESGIKSHSVVLRNNMADCICPSLMSDRGIPYQQYRTVYVFLNGEYWYSSNLREKYSKQYFEDYFGIDRDDLIIIEGNGVGSGVETDMLYFHQLYDFVKERDFTDAAVYREFCDMVDVQNYIDYIFANVYFTNMDIVMEETKNVVLWRSREIKDNRYSDGRWRFALYDMDSMEWNVGEEYGVETSAQIDPFCMKNEEDDITYNEDAIFAALRQNEDFCKQFVLTGMDLMNWNFTPEKVQPHLEYFRKNLEWRDSFFVVRPTYAREHLANEFELTGTIETVTIHNANEANGKVRVNTITPDMNNGSWSGEYFTDYPITLSAEPAEGYKFVGWGGDIVSDEPVIEVPITTGGLDITAEFEKIN